MTVNHFFILVLPRSGLITFTGDALGYVSMSEVFFFLGGFSTCIAYSSLYSPGVSYATKRGTLWNRIRILCAAEVWMVLGYCVATGCPPINFSAITQVGTSSKAIIPVALDILPVHIFILSSVALLLDRLRGCETRKILLLSALIWACAWSVGSLTRSEAGFRIPSLIFFNPFAAQLLYAVGYATAASARSGALRAARQRLLGHWTTLGLCVAALLFFSMKHFDLFHIQLVPALTSRRDFGPIRVLNFLILGALALRLSASVSLEGILSPFCVMGRRCLPIFALTTVGIYALQPLTLPRVVEAQSPTLLYLLFIAFSVSILAHFFNIIPRHARSS